MQYSLKELRARYDWTQAEAASKIGISKTAYNAWEKDFSRVKVHNALKAAQVFNVRLDEIKIFPNVHENKSCELNSEVR